MVFCHLGFENFVMVSKYVCSIFYCLLASAMVYLPRYTCRTLFSHVFNVKLLLTIMAFVRVLSVSTKHDRPQFSDERRSNALRCCLAPS